LGLVAAVQGAALGADYQAGAARVEALPGAEAVAIQDSKGGRVVLVNTGQASLPRSLTDLVAAHAGLNRAQLLFVSGAEPPADPVKLADGLVTLIGAALGDLKPATLSWTEGGGLKVSARDGTVLAVLFEHVNAGGQPRRVGGRLRAVFRLAEPKTLVSNRKATLLHENACPVQAMRFGNDLTLLALGCAVDTGFAARIRQEFPSGKEPVVVLAESSGSPLAENLEDAILFGVRTVMRRVGE
jgi:hypothetical protein